MPERYVFSGQAVTLKPDETLSIRLLRKVLLSKKMPADMLNKLTGKEAVGLLKKKNLGHDLLLDE